MPELRSINIAANITSAVRATTGQQFQAFFAKPAGQSNVTVFVANATDKKTISGLETQTKTQPVSVSINKGIISVGLGAGAASRSAGALQALAVE